MYQWRSIEDLPNETILLILENISLLPNVYSIIRSSPVIYRVFQANKRAILANVIRRCIHPLVLPLAITVCNISQGSSLSTRSLYWAIAQRDKKDTVEADFDLWRSSIRDLILRKRQSEIFWDSYIYQTTKGGSSLSSRLQDLSLVLSLCRLLNVTEFFIRDYLTEVFRSGLWNNSVEKSQCPQPFPSNCAGIKLSDSEYGRLQRGFFHYEIYRQLIRGILDMNILRERNNYLRAPQLYYEFISDLTSPEQGELWSVEDYLQRYMHNLTDQICDFLIPFVQITTRKEFLKGRYCSLDKSKLPFAYLLSRGSSGQRHVVNVFLTGLGLPFIKSFTQMKVEDRLAIAELCATQWCTPSLERVLTQSIIYPGKLWYVERGARMRFFMSHRIKRSMVKELSRQGKRLESTQQLIMHVCDCDYRQFGFFFWNDARVDGMNPKSLRLDILHSPLDANSTAKLPADLMVNETALDSVVPHSGLEMEDFIRFIEAHEY